MVKKYGWRELVRALEQHPHVRYLGSRSSNSTLRNTRSPEAHRKTIVRTPLIRLELGPDFPDIRLKLENLQPINAYKLRGAANAVAIVRS